MQGACGVGGGGIPRLLLPAWPRFFFAACLRASILHPGRVKLLAHFLYLLQKCAAFSALAHHSFHFLLTTASPPLPPPRVHEPAVLCSREEREEGGGRRVFAG